MSNISFLTCCKSTVHCSSKVTGGPFGEVARETRRSCSFCAGFSTRACDNATADNQVDRASPEKSPEHKSCPGVRVPTAMYDRGHNVRAATSQGTYTLVIGNATTHMYRVLPKPTLSGARQLQRLKPKIQLKRREWITATWKIQCF